MHLLIGILVFSASVLLTAGLIWTGLKFLRFYRLQRSADRQYRNERFDESGQPRPPRAPGLCDHCGRPFPNVIHLAGRGRVCDECLNKIRMDPARRSPNPEQSDIMSGTTPP